MRRLFIFLFVTVTFFFSAWLQAAESDEPVFSNYWEVGVLNTLLLQPSVGYWKGRYGVRVSGMYLGADQQSLNLNLGYVMLDSDQSQHTINLLTSWVVGSDPGADYKYAATGIAYGMNYRGFFAEVGLARPWLDQIGNLASEPFVPIGYIGYIHRFNISDK